MTRRAAFLDRDGVLIEEVHHLHRAEDVRLIPGAAAAVRRLRELGLAVVVVTNQSAVARGLCSEEELAGIHARLRELLRADGADWDDLLYCPHHPTEGVGRYRTACDCRKPSPGMLLEAARRHALDLGRSFLVGDKASDLEAARRVGCAAVLVRTGHGARQPPGTPSDAVVADLPAAAAWIGDRMVAP
ncbi:D-glycero-alpha-D-manno-heptose-1,7-bisphosphate 7-phosphatase [Anaeromyxobacter paludicola]|uniref:D,D-heptose 1,7-bisphosphate phosphatase n=1 Tax=Anaeromyxobacter paludicola TaxID=2918171 RepID=A0ABN6N1X7_9BACT|nr:HAD family hydrolase [Anaeromyxobacter paludicola]BDG07178.1 D,D-heptose 1,7-bisphosphate phosphatase [Anaeromyxobacter paludicola]